jgi:predicted O-methyltransferase YrrM
MDPVDTGPYEASAERLRRRVIEVRRRLVQEGPRWPHGEDFERVTVPEQDCDAIRDLLIAESVGKVVEIGFAYGSSALAIGEALASVGVEQAAHIIIDPLQATNWSNVGWRLVQSAGLDTIARLILLPSSMALPQLIADGFTADAAFVDGSHRFHDVFVDLYFLRKIVRPGGVVILDDHWWPSVRTAQRYYETNMGWQVLQGALDGVAIDEATGRPRIQALRLPDPSFEPSFEQFQPF